MARRPEASTSQIEELAASEGIPARVLEQILLSLKKAQILRSKRGVGGGYQLVRPARLLTLAEVLRATDGPFQPLGPNPEEAGPGLRVIFDRLQDEVNRFLEDVTIADVLQAGDASDGMHFEI